VNVLSRNCYKIGLFVCDLGGGDDTMRNKLRMDFCSLACMGAVLRI
jgi:hypothetical protein